ncbi:hypothetical protein Droror1_Dr00015489 [Drosera rotundifolia]
MFYVFMSFTGMKVEMASALSAAFHFLALFLLLQPHVARSDDFLSPLLSPIFDSACKEVECGKGRCVPSFSSGFLFGCECDPGWTQPLSISFLPCVIPNCTIKSSCSAAAPSPSESQQRGTNASLLDPCSWANVCGSGKCNKTSSFAYSCECSKGSSNLLNTSVLPCYRPCELGADCRNLGILLYNISAASPPPPALPDHGKNQACSPCDRNLHLLRILVATTVFLFLGFGF